MGGVSHQGESWFHKGFGQGQRQWVGEPCARQRNLAQKIAKARAQGGQIACVIHRLNLGRRRIGLAPDDRRMKSAGQRQNRQGTRRHEELMRGALVIVLMAHRCYQRGLPIAPALPPNARPLGRARTAAIAAHQHPAPQGSPRGEPHCHPLRVHLLRHHAFARQKRQPRRFGHRREKRRIKPPIFDHEPHRAFFQFGMVKGQEKRRGALACAAIAGLDLQDRLHLGL